MQPSELKLFYAGDEIFFGTLVSSVEVALRHQIRRYVGADSDAVDDLFQDTCIKIFERRRSFRGDGPFGAWCRRVCARVCLDQLRRAFRVRERVLSLDGQFDAAADSRSEPYRTHTAEAFQARLDTVTDAVVALAPRRRLIAILHWYLGWTAGRIARELHLTAPTVWTTLWKIRATLRVELAPLVRVAPLTPI
jgi:RNA polymerase sigma-70 factor (ECF subfamily)